MIKKTERNIGMMVGKWVSVCLMIFCLTFLTSINYFIYSADSSTLCESMNGDDTENSNFPPSGPTEEKSASSGINFAEEMLHETHPEIDLKASSLFYLHHIAETEKIQLFHPEIILPPPKA